MVAFGHTAIGAGIGLVAYHYFGPTDPVKGLSLAMGVGIVSHYIADFIPHGHFFSSQDFNKKIIFAIIFDLFLSVAIALGIIYFREGLSLKLLYVLTGISGSQLPDVLDGLIHIKKIPNQGLFRIEYYFHSKAIHWHGAASKALLWGKRDLWQVMVAMVVLIALCYY